VCEKSGVGDRITLHFPVPAREKIMRQRQSFRKFTILLFVSLTLSGTEDAI
jgi:hypothetical protein